MTSTLNAGDRSWSPRRRTIFSYSTFYLDFTRLLDFFQRRSKKCRQFLIPEILKTGKIISTEMIPKIVGNFLSVYSLSIHLFNKNDFLN